MAMDQLEVLRDVATGPLAGPALLAGVIAAVVVVLSGRIAPGPALALAVGVAAWSLDQVPMVLLAGVAGVAARDHLQQGLWWRRIVGLIAGAAGAAVVAAVLYPPLLTVGVALLAALILPVVLEVGDQGGWGGLAEQVGRRAKGRRARTGVRSGGSRALGGRLDGLLLLITLFGVFATVPDTELAIIALAAAVPIAMVAQVRAGGAASLAIVVVIAASGGVPRTASLVGALGCLGVLALPDEDGPWWARLAVHAGVVFLASRVAGLGTDVLIAALIVAAALGFAALILSRLPTGGRLRLTGRQRR